MWPSRSAAGPSFFGSTLTGRAPTAPAQSITWAMGSDDAIANTRAPGAAISRASACRTTTSSGFVPPAAAVASHSSRPTTGSVTANRTSCGTRAPSGMYDAPSLVAIHAATAPVRSQISDTANSIGMYPRAVVWAIIAAITSWPASIACSNNTSLVAPSAPIAWIPECGMASGATCAPGGELATGAGPPLLTGCAAAGVVGAAGPAAGVLLTGVTGVAPAAPPAGGIIAIGAPPAGVAAAGVVNAAGFAAAAACCGACAAAVATFCATWLPTLPTAPSPPAAPLIAPEAIRAEDSATPEPKLANPGARPALAAAAPVALALALA